LFQVQKFSVNKESVKAMQESLGKFYQEGIEMPEPPKQSFFKGFFGGGTKALDREELFGESKASSTIAVKTEVAMMTQAQANAAAGGSEIAKAKEAVCERGNKLNEVEEKTEQMASEAKVTSHPYTHLTSHIWSFKVIGGVKLIIHPNRSGQTRPRI